MFTDAKKVVTIAPQHSEEPEAVMPSSQEKRRRPSASLLEQVIDELMDNPRVTTTNAFEDCTITIDLNFR